MIASDDEWVDETEWDNMFMKMNVAGNCHRRMTSPTVIQSVESMLPR